jgi:pseudaminic acid biosynthesis-associated methylase
MPSHRTEQEDFWAGAFGDAYVDRNSRCVYVARRTALFAKVLANTTGVQSIVELGANVGLNLLAIRNLLPEAALSGVEINTKAFHMLRQIGGVSAILGSILEHELEPADLAFTSGVLIHIAPDSLPTAYERLYKAAKRYVVVIEYYNSTPVEVTYRGHSGRLFKRDFAGEMINIYPDLYLRDYGFIYHRDPAFPQDDITWFLMEKHSARVRPSVDDNDD